MYDEFFAKAHELIGKGEPFATATVVRAEKPTSGKPGDKAIITLDGVMYGWIGGSCAQPAVIEEARAAIAEDSSRLVRITPTPGRETAPEGVKEVAMTCFSGGTLDVYVEPQQPRPRLLIIGHLPAAQALAHLGKAMSYRVVAVDPEGTGAMAHADEVLSDLDRVASRIDPVTYVVVASHGHYDEAALERVLATRAPYIGLVASRQRAAPILDHLRRQGFGDDDLARIEAPAGLDIGARRGDEIAVSIIAEIVQIRSRAGRVDWAAEEEPGGAADGTTRPSTSDGEAEPTAAVDPVCGMTVRTRDAKYTHEHLGTVFYFCCEGCRAKFTSAPEPWLAGEASSRLSHPAG